MSKPWTRSGDASIGEANAEGVIGPVRYHAGKGNPGLSVEVDEILRRRRAHDTPEQADALRILAARHAPDELIDDAVETPIAVDRPARIEGDADGQAARIETLILEGAEVIPSRRA